MLVSYRSVFGKLSEKEFTAALLYIKTQKAKEFKYNLINKTANLSSIQSY